MAVERRFEVKSRLTAEEFVAFNSMAETKGLSQSSLIRMWIKESIATHCAEQLFKPIAPERDNSGTSNVRPFDFRIANR